MELIYDAYLADAVTTVVDVQAGSSLLGGWHIVNSGASDAWLHVYNAEAADVTVGTTARAISWFIPAGGILDAQPGTPLLLQNGIAIAATTTLTGSTAPATGLTVNLYYR